MDKVEERIRGEDFGKITSLILLHERALIYEKYFGNRDRHDLHYIASDTKSITSLLFGIARDQGHIKSLGEKVLSIFSDIDIQHPDDRKSAISIEHLLTMTAGFEWDEWIPYADPANSNTQLKASEDWVAYTLNQRMADAPGEKFVYNSGALILLGEIVKRKTNQSVIEFAVENLFKPLKINDFEWTTKNGVTHCGGGLQLRPIDMAKIGYLVLQNGKWGNQSVVSEDWIDRSFQKKTAATFRFNYGYQWWNFEPALDILDDIGHASGHGDQYIFMIRDLDMVIVMTGENYEGEIKHTAYDLLFEILKTNPDYQSKVFEKYAWISEIQVEDYDYADIEYMNIAYELISYGGYRQAIEVLDKLPKESNATNWFYLFLYGKAYYHINDEEKTIDYLNKHLEHNPENSLHEQAYADWAMEMLQDLN